MTTKMENVFVKGINPIQIQIDLLGDRRANQNKKRNTVSFCGSSRVSQSDLLFLDSVKVQLKTKYLFSKYPALIESKLFLSIFHFYKHHLFLDLT